MLTLVAESGTDASTVGRIASPSSVVISQRYVQRWPEAPKRAFARLETSKVAENLSDDQKMLLPAIVSATV